MKRLLLISITYLSIITAALGNSEKGAPDPGDRPNAQAEKEARERAAAEAQKRSQQEATRLANIQEAQKLREAAQKSFDEAQSQRIEAESIQRALNKARGEFTDELQRQTSLRAELDKDQKRISDDKEKLQFEKEIFGASTLGLLLTNLFTLYQLFSGRTNRKLVDEKAKLEIELLKTKLAHASSGAPPSDEESV
jgi:hypothetical protein